MQIIELLLARGGRCEQVRRFNAMKKLTKVQRQAALDEYLAQRERKEAQQREAMEEQRRKNDELNAQKLAESQRQREQARLEAQRNEKRRRQQESEARQTRILQIQRALEIPYRVAAILASAPLLSKEEMRQRFEDGQLP